MAFSRTGAAAPPEIIPLNSVFCAALLVAPEFDLLGRARPVDLPIPALDQVPAGELATQVVELAALDGKTPRKLMFNREFKGESDIRAYIDGVLAVSDELQAEVDAGEPTFWTRDRVRAALKTAGYPALSVAVVIVVALESYLTKHMHVEASAIGLLSSLAMFHLQKPDYYQTGRYLRAAVRPRARLAARNHERQRALAPREFLLGLRDGVVPEDSSALIANVPPALSDLILDPPSAFDSLGVQENYRGLLNDQLRGLADYKNDRFSHSYFIDFEAYTDADSVPHLRVSVSMIRLETGMRPPRAPRRRAHKRMKVSPGGLIPVGI